MFSLYIKELRVFRDKDFAPCLYGQFFSAFGASSFYYLTTAFCAHPFKEAMCPFTFPVMRTIGSISHLILLHEY